MSRAIETLMTEHRLIEQVLGSLQTFAGQVAPGQPEARQRVAEYAEFFREYADRAHHGKEEDLLFEAMAGHGFPTNGGPIFVMLKEHEMGRSLVRGLAEIGGGAGELTADEVAKIQSHSSDFIPLLAAHIQKEDRILYPAAENALPAAVFETMAADFDRFDTTDFGTTEHQRLHALADALAAAFPPDPAGLPFVGGCGMG